MGIKNVAICVNSAALDQVYSAMIMAAAATTMAEKVDVCIAMGGVNAFVKGNLDKLPVASEVGELGQTFKKRLEETNYTSLADLLKQAKEAGNCQIHCCQPALELYGYSRDDLVDEVDDIIGAAAALEISANADSQLVY